MSHSCRCSLAMFMLRWRDNGCWCGSVLNDECMCVCCSLTFSGSRCWLRVGQLHLRDLCVNASFCSHSTLVVYLMVVCRINQYPLCCQFTQSIKNGWSHALPFHWCTVVDWSQFSALPSSMNIVKRNAAVVSLAHAIQNILMWRHAEQLLCVVIVTSLVWWWSHHVHIVVMYLSHCWNDKLHVI